VPRLSHLTSCTPSKPNLVLDNSLATLGREPDLYMLLTFHAPKPMPPFHCLDHTKEQAQARGICMRFVTRSVFKVRSCSHLAQPPKPEAHILSAVRDCLLNNISSYPPYWRPLLHPQPADAPCRGDRDPLIMRPGTHLS
jgi:hypothetical protein